ncbi:MAG: calcineurin-like phosphoesterase C-terminal domain-containing protein [Bacteroidales bacterium]|nr:calcineurin-like phosphoesterase C-terminal domain-containing protein [Bacteroidales bacterium]
MKKMVLAAVLLLVAGGASAEKIGGTRILRGNDLAGVITDAETGRGIPGVAVTDGFKFVVTDRNGVYQMKADPRCRTVSYTTPSAYEIALSEKGHTPAFYAGHTPGMAFARHDFVLKRLDRDEADFTMIMLADPQCQLLSDVERFRTETMPDLREYIDGKIAGGKWKNVYAMTLGDIIYDDQNDWQPMREIMSDVAIRDGQDGYLPIFQVIGNHDHYNSYYDDYGAATNFVRHFGPTDYSFDRGKVHFVVMDNVYYTGRGTVPEKGFTKVKYTSGFTPEQVEWLRQDLALVADKADKMVVFCAHIPLRGLNGDKPGKAGYNNGAVLDMLAGFREAHLMIGHTHYPEMYYHQKHVTAGGQPVMEHIHGAVCGAWWHSNTCVDGTPLGYAAYEVKGACLYDWQPKFTRRSESYQLRVYDGNASYTGGRGIEYKWEEDLRDCFVATVWYDDDRNWEVVLEMDGKTWPMHRVTRPQRDWYAYSFFINENGRGITNTAYMQDCLHFWTVSIPGVKPSGATGWRVVATQTVPTSGVRHRYTADRIATGYEGL